MECRHADPVGQRRPVNVDAGPGQDLRLPVQGAMIRIFADQHMGDGPFGRQPALDQPGQGRRLRDPVGAGSAGVFGSHGHDHPALRGHDVQTLGANFADLVHQPAAAWALQAVRLDHLFDTRQTLGQVATIAPGAFLALGLVVAGDLLGLLLFDLGEGNLNILESQLPVIVAQLF